MKKLTILVVIVGSLVSSLVMGQDVTYNTITTTSTDASSKTSLRILGQNSPVGPASARNISFDFNNAGKAQIQAYRSTSWGTFLQLLTSDDGNPGGEPTVRMHINGNGNVGIGTTEPETKLNVNVGSGGSNGTVGLRIGSVSNYPSLEFGIENDYDGVIRTYGNDLKIYAGNWRSVGAVASENHAIYFHTSKLGSANWSTPKMVLNSEGNLGIGISSPSEKLAVNGNIRAKEIKVENANWPDYVFSKDYELPSLTEIEKHIKEKGHLADIPSAAAIKENGIDLGEMNASLLKKIEELTLHVIELNKNMQKQQTEINNLKRK